MSALNDDPSELLLAQHVDTWKRRKAAAFEDPAWLSARERWLDARKRGLDEMPELLAQLRTGTIDAHRFREQFDHQTRNAWVSFGFKGNSGAMLLNILVKHIEDSGLTRELVQALTVPADEVQALAQMRKFSGYLGGLIESGQITRGSAQPNRVPFFVSAWWHVQAPEAWPVFYKSIRDLLEQDGLLGQSQDRIDQYFQLRRVFLALARQLNIGTWDLEHVALHSTAKPGPKPTIEPAPPTHQGQQTWLFSPGAGARYWDEFVLGGIMTLGAAPIGRLDQYEDHPAFIAAWRKARGATGRNPVNAALASFNFVYRIQPGDLVIAKRGRNQIIGWGIVKSEYRYDPSQPNHSNLRDVEWHPIEPADAAEDLITKTLTNISTYEGLVLKLRKLAGVPDDGSTTPTGVQEEPDDLPEYTDEQAMAGLFFAEGELQMMLSRLAHKKNVILQGPPGVGKTFVARRLAYRLIGAEDRERVRTLQFHQSYSYEDFVQGFRPDGNGFRRQDGPFLRFCKLAAQDPTETHVLIIDEINRGNLSKIFGELLTLIETDKRGREYAVVLTYAHDGDTAFYVPPNLHIIGTMNTADRSLAVVDYALRRRFAFISVEPQFTSSMFSNHLRDKGVQQKLIDEIVSRFKRLNERISQDLGEGYQIGHSYFCDPPDGEADENWYELILQTEIMPLLSEYWFDDGDRLEQESKALYLDE